MNFQNYKFHPSSIGSIMVGLDKPNLTEAQSKLLNDLLAKIKLTDKQAEARDELLKKQSAKKQLSAGAITYVKNLVDQIYYEYNEEINSKYLDKGIICEQQAIDYLNDNLLTNYTKFPDGIYENEYITSRGCDIKDGRKVRDIKNAWSKKTMPRFKSEVMTHEHKWQGVSYMWLFDADEFHIDYVLMPTPVELRGYELDCLHDVENLPFKKRYKTDMIKRSKELENIIIQAVKLARVEMQKYWDLLIND